MGTTAEECVWDGREARQDGPVARTKLIVEPPAAGGQGLGLGSGNEPIGRTKSPQACGLVVGGLDFRVRSRQDAHRPGNDSSNGWKRLATSGAGWVGRIVFVFHAIAVSFDNDCLPVMHQPV